MAHSYRSEDVQQILQRALTRQQEAEFSQEQLVEMAAELGIAPDTLQQAEQEWLAQQGEVQERREFNAYLRRSFKANLVTYLAVCTFLVLINLFSSPGSAWAQYPILGWGLGLFFQGRGAYHPEGLVYEKMLQKWRKKRLKYTTK